MDDIDRVADRYRSFADDEAAGSSRSLEAETVFVAVLDRQSAAVASGHGDVMRLLG